MVNPEEDFRRFLEHKMKGGVPLDVFVSSSVWMGGVLDSWSHRPFVAIGPDNWDGEDELSFFKNNDEVEQFIDRLREASRSAFGTSE